MPDETVGSRATGLRTRTVATAAPPLPSWLAGIPGAKHVTGGIWDITVTGLGVSWVGPYDELAKFVKTTGLKLDAAHLVGREHLKDIGSRIHGDKAPSIALDPRLHKLLTDLVTGRQFQELGGRATRTHQRGAVKVADIRSLYRTVYGELPELLRMTNAILDAHASAGKKQSSPPPQVRSPPEGAPSSAQRGTDARLSPRRAVTSRSTVGAPAFRGSVRSLVGGGFGIVASALPAAGLQLNNSIIQRDREAKKEAIREFRMQGLWVAVYALYDSRNVTDVLRNVDPTIDDVAIGVSLRTGRSPAEATGNQPDRWEAYRPGQLRRRAPVFVGVPKEELLQLLAPFDIQASDASILGRYSIVAFDQTAREDDFPIRRQLFIPSGTKDLPVTEFKSTHPAFQGIQQGGAPVRVPFSGPRTLELRFVKFGTIPGTSAARPRPTSYVAGDSPYAMRSQFRFVQKDGQTYLVEQFVGFHGHLATLLNDRMGRRGYVVWKKG